jgi:hypothetical protein
MVQDSKVYSCQSINKRGGRSAVRYGPVYY